VIDAWYNKQ
jgi:hypothetical protein